MNQTQGGASEARGAKRRLTPRPLHRTSSARTRVCEDWAMLLVHLRRPPRCQVRTSPPLGAHRPPVKLRTSKDTNSRGALPKLRLPDMQDPAGRHRRAPGATSFAGRPINGVLRLDNCRPGGLGSRPLLAATVLHMDVRAAASACRCQLNGATIKTRHALGKDAGQPLPERVSVMMLDGTKDQLPTATGRHGHGVVWFDNGAYPRIQPHLLTQAAGPAHYGKRPLSPKRSRHPRQTQRTPRAIAARSRPPAG